MIIINKKKTPHGKIFFSIYMECVISRKLKFGTSFGNMLIIQHMFITQSITGDFTFALTFHPTQWI